MYKILIVEDEAIEREYLISTIKRYEQSLLEIYSAKNGEEGLQLFEKYKPDIVISDISMPIMDGLTLVDKIKELNKETICYLLTSYDYFSYAQKGMRIGVEDYILKPCNRFDLYKLLTKTIEQLKQNNNVVKQVEQLIEKNKKLHDELKQNCFYSIMTLRDAQQVLDTLNRLNIQATSGFCMILKKNRVDIIFELEDLGYSCIYQKVGQIIILFVLFNYDMNESEYIAFYREKIREDAYVYFGGLVQDISKLYDSYEQANYKFQTKQQDKIPTLEEEHYDLNKMIALFYDSLEKSDVNQLYYIAKKVYIHHPKSELESTVTYIVEQIIKQINDLYDFNLEKEYVLKEEYPIHCYSDLEIRLIKYYHSIQKPFQAMRQLKSTSYYKRAIQYIETHYHKTISLNDVAIKLEVTPTYLSKVIHKEGKESFSEIVNNYRINQTKKLIKSGVPLKRIAHEVGFASQSYFSKIFKKKVGISPGEYKNLFD